MLYVVVLLMEVVLVFVMETFKVQVTQVVKQFKTLVAQL